MIKIYQTYILKSYFKVFSFVFLSFFSLIIILNIFEEISFFKDTESSLLTPFLLTFLNAPSVVYETFPFIFFISIQFFFIKLLDKEELDIFKKISLSNFKLISLISFFFFNFINIYNYYFL